MARSLTEQPKSIPVPTTAMCSFENVVSAKERASSGVKWQGAENGNKVGNVIPVRDQLYHCGVGAADGGGVELAMQASCEIKGQ